MSGAEEIRAPFGRRRVRLRGGRWVQQPEAHDPDLVRKLHALGFHSSQIACALGEAQDVVTRTLYSEHERILDKLRLARILELQARGLSLPEIAALLCIRETKAAALLRGTRGDTP
jgi:hypothetical protein